MPPSGEAPKEDSSATHPLCVFDYPSKGVTLAGHHPFPRRRHTTEASMHQSHWPSQSPVGKEKRVVLLALVGDLEFGLECSRNAMKLQLGTALNGADGGDGMGEGGVVVVAGDNGPSRPTVRGISATKSKGMGFYGRWGMVIDLVSPYNLCPGALRGYEYRTALRATVDELQIRPAVAGSTFLGPASSWMAIAK